MPLYNVSAFAPLPEVAIPAKPAYFFGSLPVDTEDTLLRISNVAVTTNVATVIGTIYAGNIPVAGNYISISGCANTEFNVSDVAITSVSAPQSPDLGVYTITFALTHADVVAVADAGMAIIPIAETAEACANGTSVAIYVPSNELRDLGQRSITVATTFPSLPTAATVTLYTAIRNDPTGAEWTSMGVVATVAGGVVTVPATGGLVTFSTPAGRFFRLVITSASGGSSPLLTAKMVC